MPKNHQKLTLKFTIIEEQEQLITLIEKLGHD
jgi:hypothetical protein